MLTILVIFIFSLVLASLLGILEKQNAKREKVLFEQKEQKLLEKQILAEKELKQKRENDFLKIESIAKKHYDLVIQSRIKYIHAVCQSVVRHINQLRTKEAQLCYRDAYGRMITDGFKKELIQFTRSVVISETKKHTPDKNLSLLKSYKYFEDNAQIVKKLGKKFAKKYLIWKKEFFNFIITITSDNNDTKILLNQITLIDNVICFKFKKMPFQYNDGIDLDYDMFYSSAKPLFGNPSFNIETNYINKYNLLEFCEKWSNCTYLLVEYLYKYFSMKFSDKAKTNYIDKQVSPLEYESLISSRLRNLGFDAHTTKASGDQGADVIAKKEGVSFAIQCKKHSNPIGNRAVQEVNAGQDFYKCDYGVVVSNTGFTKSARHAANACGIILLNDNELERLLKYIKD